MSCISPIPQCVRAWIGIDVSKLTLDACFVALPTAGQEHKRHKRFANTPAGWQKLLDWVQQMTPLPGGHFALEPTGAYGEGLALFLSEQNLRVSLVNPARVRHAALAAGICNKTDKLDAYAIARFCRNENPALYTPPAPEFRKLAALVRRRENLLDSLQQEKNRLDQPELDKEVRASLSRQVRFLEKETARLEKALCEHIRSQAHLAADATLLESIPGISTLTAQKILAELGDAHEYASAGSAAAYAGLSPHNHTSGTSVKKKSRLTKRGNAYLRKAMYFPTVTALTWNPQVKAFYERLVAAGKPKMVALAAAMRKLLMIAVGVLRSGKPFDPRWSEKAVEARQKMAAAAT